MAEGVGTRLTGKGGSQKPHMQDNQAGQGRGGVLLRGKKIYIPRRDINRLLPRGAGLARGQLVGFQPAG